MIYMRKLLTTTKMRSSIRTDKPALLTDYLILYEKLKRNADSRNIAKDFAV